MWVLDMPRYSALDRFGLKTATKVAELVMAPANRREVFDQFVMTVTAVAELSAHMRRITFHAPELASFATTGPDEYFGLLMATDRELVMPADDRINVRSSLRAMPEDTRPDLRWYSVRAHRPGTAEIDVDFVVHGDAGPGTRWARRASTGEKAGFRAAGSAYLPVDGTIPLAADETALPALAAILEVESRPVHVFVEVPDESYRVPLDAEWVFRGENAPGSAVVEAIRAADLSSVDYGWACGESGLATGVRRHLVKDRGVDRKRSCSAATGRSAPPGCDYESRPSTSCGAGIVWSSRISRTAVPMAKNSVTSPDQGRGPNCPNWTPTSPRRVVAATRRIRTQLA